MASEEQGAQQRAQDSEGSDASQEVEVGEMEDETPFLERSAGYIRRVLHTYREGNRHELSWQERAVATPAQLILLTARELLRDRLVERASSLSFFSVLSIVPLLSVVTALLGAFGVFHSAESDLAAYLVVLFPAVGAEMVKYLQEFSMRGASSIGGINGVVLLVISIFLFNSIERSLTAMWNGAHNRSLVAKFLMFYTMITLGPLLLILSVVQTASAQLFLDSRLGIDTTGFDRLLPFGYALVVFTLMNKILPNVKVDWRSALFGGLVTALGFELAKFGFNQYVAFFLSDSYNRLYGALGTVAIFFLWVYVTWMVILIGSELAYCYQHMERLLQLDTPLEETLFMGRHQYERLYDPLVCLDVLTPIMVAYRSGEGAVSEDYVAFATGYDAAVVRDVVERLVDDRVLLVTGMTRRGVSQIMPAKPMANILLVDVVALFTGARSRLKEAEVLQNLREDHWERLKGVLEGKTAWDLANAQVLDEETREIIRRESGDERLSREGEALA